MTQRGYRATNILAAADAAIARVDPLGPVLFGPTWSAAVAESVIWLVACDDLLNQRSAYRTQRDADPDGCTLHGLRYVRNLAVHGDTVIAIAHAQPGAELGRLVLDSSRLDSRSTFGWLSRTKMPDPGRPPGVAVVPAYDSYVSGQEVSESLRRALAFARREVGIRWP